ncbi:hypothetical protein GCM10010922_15400 [Microbacterium sorbitolivorans]|uniref:ATP-binding cassette domain-containing protein n=1 Tax=Microbacterium sorbitolivorans TaxID=1867410 RepID=UPI0019A1C745|nr:ATP-binding cassette domain-containing protein [Microbacterium sorbitolivorans]GGF40889.1 hypothetical protein GCM10010922_15400 [Microbacterium sorbitolivorans]
MSEGKVIEFVGVSMTFGDTPAVEDLTARVEPGRVTAFLGPNGAGKTTTLRMLLGDLRATNGTATIGGTEYTRIAKPASSIGAVMSIAPLERARRKTATKYLTRSARRIGVGSSRVREVLQIVGLGEMGDMRIGSLSLGMKHRLAVAEALLGDPGVLVFDEPANGLDPEGIRWIRLLMRGFADEGRTVLMSSHLLSEVEQVADALLILNEGRVLFEGPIELLAEAEGGMVTVDADDRAALAKALTSAGLSYRVLRSGLAIDDTTTSEIGSLAKTAGIALTTLTHRGPTLEDVYLQIIDGSWVAPARTAALAPAPLSFDDVLVGEPADAEGEAAVVATGAAGVAAGGAAGAGAAAAGTAAGAGLAAAGLAGAAAAGSDSDDDAAPAESGEADPVDEDPEVAENNAISRDSEGDDAEATDEDPADAKDPEKSETSRDAEADDAEDTEKSETSRDAEADDAEDTEKSETSRDGAEGAAAAGFPAASFALAADDEGSAFPAASFELPADEAEDDAANSVFPAGTFDDTTTARTAAVAAGSLPGVAGLAGLANGLRSDDEASDDDIPDGLVSPGLAAAFARAGELEAQMGDIEADIETQEIRADNVDAVAEIEAMFETRDADGATATVIEVDPFPGEGLGDADGGDGD